MGGYFNQGGFGTKRFNVGARDPFFSNVDLLLTANTGVLREWSGIPTVSVTGGGAISSAQAKFNGTSFRNPGTNTQNTNYVRISQTGNAFVFTGPFTWEGWFYLVSFNTDTYSNFFANQINFPSAGFLQYALIRASAALLFNSAPGGSVSSAGGVFSINQWIFATCTRDSSNTLRNFVNGTVVTTTPGYTDVIGGTVLGDSSFDVGRGQAADNSDINCYFDQIRVTNGVCRYAANFPVPTQPFPTS